MAIPKSVSDFLKKNKIKYKVLKHKNAYTAQEVAGAQRVSGHQVAKSVIVKIGKDFGIAVLPASFLVDFKKLKKTVGKFVSLAKEKEAKKILPKDIKVGAQPPFGTLYNLPTFIDKKLSEFDEIVATGGSYTDTLKMKVSDLLKVTKAKISSFSK